MKDRANGVHNRINAFEDIKDELEEILDELRKKSPKVFYEKRRSEKFHKIRRKKFVPESLFFY